MAEQDPDTTKAEALATQTGALSMRKLSLIGTMGTDSLRRALVRLPDGRIEQVEVGDTLQGQRIDAIEPERLLMSRNGRQRILSMPHG
ncbi:MAG: hypothetical protein WAO69_11030 [Aestuariivita sp.]|uniref:hypothetical protein n=1 Tax=Aestuariivita sp. TaxID=1872407 RepID=UPI003BB143C9